jgi:hypothetical protein
VSTVHSVLKVACKEWNWNRISTTNLQIETQLALKHHLFDYREQRKNEGAPVRSTTGTVRHLAKRSATLSIPRFYKEKESK